MGGKGGVVVEEGGDGGGAAVQGGLGQATDLGGGATVGAGEWRGGGRGGR